MAYTAPSNARDSSEKSKDTELRVWDSGDKEHLVVDILDILYGWYGEEKRVSGSIASE